MVNSALGSPRAPDDIELFNLPAFGIGLLHFAVPTLLGGATVVLDGSFAAERAWTLLAEERATRTFLAPTMISAMLEVPGHEDLDLPALRTIYTAYEFPERLRERAWSASATASSTCTDSPRPSSRARVPGSSPQSRRASAAPWGRCG